MKLLMLVSLTALLASPAFASVTPLPSDSLTAPAPLPPGVKSVQELVDADLNTGLTLAQAITAGVGKVTTAYTRYSCSNLNDGLGGFIVSTMVRFGAMDITVGNSQGSAKVHITVDQLKALVAAEGTCAKVGVPLLKP